MFKDPQLILENARSWLDKGIEYQMGADNLKKMDCSAFVWRCLGERKYDGKVWRNTDWLCSPSALKFFKRLDGPTPGCIVVYPSTTILRPNGTVIRRAGHTAVVSDPVAKTIIDCSSSQNGIRERKGDFFWNHHDVVWLSPL